MKYYTNSHSIAALTIATANGRRPGTPISRQMNKTLPKWHRWPAMIAKSRLRTLFTGMSINSDLLFESYLTQNSCLLSVISFSDSDQKERQRERSMSFMRRRGSSRRRRRDKRFSITQGSAYEPRGSQVWPLLSNRKNKVYSVQNACAVVVQSVIDVICHKYWYIYWMASVLLLI